MKLFGNENLRSNRPVEIQIYRSYVAEIHLDRLRRQLLEPGRQSDQIEHVQSNLGAVVDAADDQLIGDVVVPLDDLEDANALVQVVGDVFECVHVVAVEFVRDFLAVGCVGVVELEFEVHFAEVVIVGSCVTAKVLVADYVYEDVIRILHMTYFKLKIVVSK